MSKYIGQVFKTNGGVDCVVIEYNRASNVLVQFLDSHRYQLRTRLEHLRNGKVKNPYATMDRLLGQVFPTNCGTDCVITEYNGCYDVTVKFLDEYNHKVKSQMSHITRGLVKNPYAKSIFGVGYIGVGEFKSVVGGKTTKEYLCWYNMMMRVYCPSSQENHPTYLGCSVSKEWQDFQVFARWFTEHRFYRDGYELDKDILFKGNRLYSENTCTLVPKRINAVVNNSTEPSLIRQAALEERGNMEAEVFEALMKW